MDEIDWATRATAWELAALSFRYPGPELEGAVASGEWAEAAREIAGALGLALPEGFGAGASAGGAAPRGHAPVRGRAPPAVSPYEGVMARGRRRGAGAPVREPALHGGGALHARVRAWEGLEGTNEPLDHVATGASSWSTWPLRAAGAEPPEGAPSGSSPAPTSPAAVARRRPTGLPRGARPTIALVVFDALIRRRCRRVERAASLLPSPSRVFGSSALVAQ